VATTSSSSSASDSRTFTDKYKSIVCDQCCGSGMIIPDPNFSIPDPGSKRDQVATTSSTSSANDSRTFANKKKLSFVSSVADPGCLSRIRIFPSRMGQKDSGSRIPQRIKYFQPKKLFLSSQKYDPGCSSRIRVLIFFHPGSRGQKGTGSWIRNAQHCLLHCLKIAVS
jgi:hypothetical protein